MVRSFLIKGLKIISVTILPGFAISPAAEAQIRDTQNVEISGYIKDLQTFILQPGSPISADQLIHDRINFQWNISDQLRLHAALRSRLFLGDQVQAIPDYGELVDREANDVIDLSILLEDEGNVVFHSYFDRLYLEYIPEDWEVRLGRQRINWGINNYWNPNDLFNAFSFIDFDYEERPGADAIRLKHYTGIASSIEFAVKAYEDPEDLVAGAMWKFNHSEYDFQVLGAWYRELITVGGGWAGNLGNAGFKGEMSAFIPSGQPYDQEFSVSAATQVDYVFSNGLYGTGGILFNSLGATDGSLSQLFDFELDARRLYPFKFAFLGASVFNITPLLSANMTFVYSPVSSHPLFAGPSFTCSIATNWDLDLVGQFVFNVDEGRYRSPVQVIFLRVKFSY